MGLSNQWFHLLDQRSTWRTNILHIGKLAILVEPDMQEIISIIIVKYENDYQTQKYITVNVCKNSRVKKEEKVYGKQIILERILS